MQKGHSLFYNHAQQPPDVVACSAQYRVQTVTERCLEVAAVHAVIGFEVADDGLDGLSAFEVFLLLLRQALELAPVLDADARVVLLHTPVAQVCVDRLRLNAQVLHQDA